MLTRPPSSPAMAKEKPWPSPPTRLDTGTRTLSKLTMAVGWAFQPIFRSGAPNDSPAAPFSTTTVEMPLGPSSPVRTITT